MPDDVPSTTSNRALRPFAPTRFGRYTLLTPIAQGGMAQVYLARVDGVKGFEKLVVIKKILPQLAREATFVRRFLDEGKIVVKLQHGSIAQVIDMGQEGDDYYLAMEFVDGKDLRKIAARCRELKSPMPPALALQIFVRVLDGLAYAHRKRDDDDRELNLVHRDVSPQNILVSYEGLVKVIDFGLAKSAQSLSNTAPSMILGKFFYMSPEQARHQPVDRRGDLYAAGISLYELLAGKNPFESVPQIDLLHAVANPAIPPLKSVCSVTDRVNAVVMTALEIDPAKRFQTADEMRGELSRALAEIDSASGPEALAAFMRKAFEREYATERKMLASLSRSTSSAARVAVEPPAPAERHDTPHDAPAPELEVEEAPPKPPSAPPARRISAAKAAAVQLPEPNTSKLAPLPESNTAVTRHPRRAHAPVLIGLGAASLAAAAILATVLFRPGWLGLAENAPEIEELPTELAPVEKRIESPPAAPAAAPLDPAADLSVVPPEPKSFPKGLLTKANLERLLKDADVDFNQIKGKHPREKIARLCAAYEKLSEQRPLIYDPQRLAELEAWYRWFNQALEDTQKRLEP